MNGHTSIGELVAPPSSPTWSSSDPVHSCLRDTVRTEAFLRAIRACVRPGDRVVEPGAGSGILTLQAAACGARVWAIELDPLLAGWLTTTVAINGFADRITVIHDDALRADLPHNVDVVVAEMIETGLIDELQVPVMNAFHERGVIGPDTQLIPERYTTLVDLVGADNRFYGYQIAAPIHDWKDLRVAETGWLPVGVLPLTDQRHVITVDFCALVEPRVERRLCFTATADGTVNALRLIGVAHLLPGLNLGATNAINGDKVLRLLTPLAVRAGQPLAGMLRYEMGGGLGSVRWEWEEPL